LILTEPDTRCSRNQTGRVEGKHQSRRNTIRCSASSTPIPAEGIASPVATVGTDGAAACQRYRKFIASFDSRFGMLATM
jgi:hypothetical protein